VPIVRCVVLSAGRFLPPTCSPGPPGRCQILPGKLPVKGLPGAKRRDAAVGRALDWELSRRQDRPAREDGLGALAGAVTGDA
jgi:hypothetical protein